jgi:hypothetical protein
MKINWNLIGAIFFALVLFFGVLLFIANIQLNPYYKIVADKTIEKTTGAFSNIRYVIAYEDGDYDYVSFGKYSILEKGDSIWFNNYKNNEK